MSLIKMIFPRSDKKLTKYFISENTQGEVREEKEPAAVMITSIGHVLDLHDFH